MTTLKPFVIVAAVISLTTATALLIKKAPATKRNTPSQNADRLILKRISDDTRTRLERGAYFNRSIASFYTYPHAPNYREAMHLYEDSKLYASYGGGILLPEGLLAIEKESYFSGDHTWSWELYLEHHESYWNYSLAKSPPSCMSDPKGDWCMLPLIKNGTNGDDITWVEYSVSRKTIVNNGFTITGKNSSIEIKDRDHLYVIHDINGNFTSSGEPRLLVELKRGQSLSNATSIYQASDESASLGIQRLPGSLDHFLVYEYQSYDRISYSVISGSVIQPLTLPRESTFLGANHKSLFFKSWDAPEEKDIIFYCPTMKANLHCKLKALDIDTSVDHVDDYALTRNGIVFNTHSTAGFKIISHLQTGDQWTIEELKLKSNLKGSLSQTGISSDYLITKSEGFLTAPKLEIRSPKLSLKASMTAHDAFFNEKDYVMKTVLTKHPNQIEVPHTIFYKKSASIETPKPTIIEAYGGFGITLHPRFDNNLIKNWIDQGGAYVIAHIRGGGKKGTKWHRDGTKFLKHNSISDLKSVIDSLINAGISPANKIALKGASNGGFIVASFYSKYPEKLAAASIEHPIIDIENVFTLGGSTAWKSDYGDPQLTELKKYWASISPLNNISREKTYPPIYIKTANNDSIASPEHARRFAHKLLDAGVAVSYYEADNGGHMDVDFDTWATDEARSFTFLYRELFSRPHKTP